MNAPTLLAQSDDSGGMGGVILISLALIALLVAGFFGVSLLRRKMKEDDAALRTPGSGGFALTDLRELHAAGKLTTEEFERAKHAIVEAARATAARKTDEGRRKDFPPTRHPPAPKPPQR